MHLFSLDFLPRKYSGIVGSALASVDKPGTDSPVVLVVV